MKRILLLLIAPLSLFAQHEPMSCSHKEHLVHMESQRAAALRTFKANPLTSDYDVIYHMFDWYIDPAQHFIEGSVTTDFIPLVAGMNKINFDLDDNLGVDSVIFQNQSLTFSFTSNVNLEINLPGPLTQGQRERITVYYRGVPTGSGFGAFATDTHQGVPVMWTLSEPYGAREWWPCKQSLNDKIDSIDIYVTTPQAYRLATNGLKISETQIGQDKRYHWKHKYAIPAYLIAIAVTNYASYSDWVPYNGGADSLEVLNYVYPEDSATASAQTPQIIPLMTLFNNLFELYPFIDEKYGHAQFGWGGGMEHQTMSFMGGWWTFLQAHELAHQWFGDKITCGSWEDIWLNEGFATYSEGLVEEHLGNATSWNAWKSSTISNITSQPGGSVWVDDTTSVNRIFSSRLSYDKGAYLLHMLRWVMGDSVFYQGVRNYLADPNLAFGYAKTPQLQSHLESVHGSSLTWFFDDWFYGQGYPSYDIQGVKYGPNGSDIELTVFQSQSHPSVSFFEMPLEIKFIGPGVDTIVVLDHQFDGQVFNLSLSFSPFLATFDINRWIISSGNTINLRTVGLEAPEKIGVKLYPNPAKNQLFFDQEEVADYLLTYSILDNSGRSLIDGRVTNKQANIDISGLAPGLYHVRILKGNRVAVEKLIVE